MNKFIKCSIVCLKNCLLLKMLKNYKFVLFVFCVFIPLFITLNNNGSVSRLFFTTHNPLYRLLYILCLLYCIVLFILHTIWFCFDNYNT